jgi:hypothetical protein
VSKSRQLWRAVLAVLVVAAAAPGAQLNGTMRDRDGRPLAGVTVAVVDLQRGVERETLTDAQGRYTIAELPAGDWWLRTYSAGLQAQFATFARVGADQTRRHDAVLSAAPVYRLENERLALAIDANGAVVELCNKAVQPAHNYIAGLTPGFWHLIFRRGMCLENVVAAEAQQYRVERPAADVLRVTVDELRCRHERLPVKITFTVRLAGDALVWSAQIDNRSDVEITEFSFPELGAIRTLGDPRRKDYLYWPNGAGERIAGFASRRMYLTHPFWASMGWFTLNNGREGLYCGTHDPTFMSGELQAGVNFDQRRQPTLGFVKYPFVRPGETWRTAPYVVAPYAGTWHVAADRYRQWMQTWRKVRPKPEWVRQMTGMFLVILNQQYGDVMWHYDEIPWLYRQAQANGMDTVALFGWTAAGHDNQYPDYRPGEKLGGEQALRAGLKQVAAAGGHTILYLNGRLMDAEGAYAKSAAGQRVATRNLWGSAYVEQYNKFSHSSLLRTFSQKVQYVADPIHPEWRRTILGQGLNVAAHGPCGLIFDQLGGTRAFPAFDAPPGVKPTLAFPQGQQQLLAELRAGLKRDAPNRGLMVELLTDVYTQYGDVIHGCGAAFAPAANAFPAMSRYVMPDLIITARNPRPRIDSRTANFALAYGFRPEIEVRYRDDVRVVRNGVDAEQAAYLRQVSQLRRRYWDLLALGRYTDTLGIEASNPAVTVTGFEQGNRRAVVAWNDTSKPESITLSVPGFRLLEVAGVDGRLTAPPLPLQPQQIAVWVFERKDR